jgi:hypothetical protein
VHPDQHTTIGSAGLRDVAHDQRQVLAAIQRGAVGRGPERAEGGGHAGGGDLLDQSLGGPPVSDEVRDRQQRQVVLPGEVGDAGAGGHRSVVGGELGDHAHPGQAGQCGEVDGCLGVAGTNEHAALSGPEREHVPGTAQLVGFGRGIGQCAHGRGAVGGRHARSGAHVVDADGEGRAVGVGTAPSSASSAPWRMVVPTATIQHRSARMRVLLAWLHEYSHHRPTRRPDAVTNQPVLDLSGQHSSFHEVFGRRSWAARPTVVRWHPDRAEGLPVLPDQDIAPNRSQSPGRYPVIVRRPVHRRPGTSAQS